MPVNAQTLGSIHNDSGHCGQLGAERFIKAAERGQDKSDHNSYDDNGYDSRNNGIHQGALDVFTGSQFFFHVLSHLSQHYFQAAGLFPYTQRTAAYRRKDCRVLAQGYGKLVTAAEVSNYFNKYLL